MHEGLQTLSEREKDTLRLLFGGHDAKSIARGLGLSVHTVNERLRDARRKLGVSSSREAARLLADAEQQGPKFLADKQLWVGSTAADVKRNESPGRRSSAGFSFAWLGGGMLIMSLIIAAVALSAVFHGNGDAGTQVGPSNPARQVSVDPSDALSLKAALAWVALVDSQQWNASWDAAGTVFRSQVPRTGWPAIVQPVREPLGSTSSRLVQTITRTTSLPNAPKGDYTVVQYRTSFARKPDAIETVILAREGSE